MEDNLIKLSDRSREKQWESFLILLTKEIFGIGVVEQIPNWKYKGPHVQPEEVILVKLEGWKKMMFCISDIAVDHIRMNESHMTKDEIKWKAEGLKSLRALLWSIIKLKDIPDKELTARSLDGEVVLVEFRKN